MTETTDPSRPKKPFAFRFSFLLLSMALAGVGVALMVAAELGVSPTDVLSTGGAARFDIGVGTMGWISGGFFTCVATFLGRRPQWGTLLGAIVVGIVINLVLQLLPEPDRLVARVPMMLVGLCLIYTAISLAVSSTLGTAPMELTMLGLADKGINMQVGRWILEAFVFTAGVLLGGQIGVGTILFVLLTGPVLARTIPPTARFMGTTVLDVPHDLDV